MAMKTFTSLFALLLFVLSASAQYYVPSASSNETCIFYEEGGNFYNHVYIWYGDNLYTGNWGGYKFKDCQTTSFSSYTFSCAKVGTSSKGHDIYKISLPASIDANAQIIFNKDAESNGQSATQTIVNHGYYYNGGYNHTVADGQTVYFYNSENWDNVHLYAFDDRGNEYKSGWSGIPMENLGNNLYKCHIEECSFFNIIFNNGGNGQQTIDLTINPSFDEKVFIPNGKNGEDKYYTITADASLSLADDQDFSCAKGHAVAEATYTRPSTGYHWGTLCLPFEIQNTYEGVTFYQLSSVTETSMKFTPIEGTIAAGTPVAFKLAAPGTLTINESNVEVIADPTTAGISNWTMKGTFQRKTLDGIYYVYNDKYYCGNNITVKPYRGWFETSAPTNGALFRIEIEEEQSLQFVEQEDDTVVATFDLQGRKLDNARKGLVIENGKIIMISM